jgi:hypothetical protein
MCAPAGADTEVRPYRRPAGEFEGMAALVKNLPRPF